MNYQEIKATTLAYIDRSDDFDLENLLDSFLRIVESRINIYLRVQQMCGRATITTTPGEPYYGLPADFAAFREVKLVEGTTKTAFEYATPHSFDGMVALDTDFPFYTLEANQLRIRPFDSAVNIEIVYYKKVPALSTTNWVGDNYPLVYISGLLVECSAYSKDSDAASLWEKRFTDALNDISLSDSIDRWSGAPLMVRVE